MVSMSAAALAAEQQVEQQQAQVEEGSGSRQVTVSSAHAASSASASISFGSGGCMTSTRAVACEASGDSELQGGVQQQRRSAGTGAQPGGGAHEGQQHRLARLARLLEDGEARGQPCTLAQLQAAGFSTHDLYSLKQWLARQQ